MVSIREFLGLSYYTSGLDEFLHLVRQNQPKLSASQRKEVDKYSRINKLRDKPTQNDTIVSFWDKF